mgnify:CR=1 FL=1
MLINCFFSSTNANKLFMWLVLMHFLYFLQEDMRDFDMESVTMTSKGFQFLCLSVPGLAERRPSLVYGDCVFARPSSVHATNTPPYQVC